MQLCTVNIVVVSLLLIVTPTMGDDCVTTTPACTTTTICPNSGGSSGTGNGGTSVGVLQFLTNSNECDKLPDGTILLDSRHCRRYYICANERAVRNRCSLGTWFDKSTRTCRPRADVKNCAANRN